MQAVGGEHPADIPVLLLVLMSELMRKSNDLLAVIEVIILSVNKLHIVPRGRWLNRSVSSFEKVALAHLLRPFRAMRLLLYRGLQL